MSGPDLTLRRRLAWWLVRIAYKLYIPEYEQTIRIDSPSGNTYTFTILGDVYGCGISSIAGLSWQRDESGADVAEAEGWTFTWTEADEDA